MKPFVCDGSTVVRTRGGRLQGFRWGDTYTFRGIRYAVAKRFEMPQPVPAWEGILPALSYGDVCPIKKPMDHRGDILVPHRDWSMSEDCQYLNVWTQSLDAQAKRPVMVWFHGGGFSSGSAIEQETYDGENLSAFGNVVVVSVTHRLNILGYLDLAPLTDRYPNAANAGTADLVAALVWVRENIAAFGGDPDNVTVFGQSGGGHKTFDLLQIPQADGLYHKLIVQSGVTSNFRYPQRGENGERVVRAMLQELGLREDQVEALAGLPYQQLADAHTKVQKALREQWVYCGETPLPNDYYAGEPILHGFRKETLDIPVMVGSVFGEFAFGVPAMDKQGMSMEEKMAMLRGQFGEDAEALVQAFQKAYPEKDLCDLMYFESCIRLSSMRFLSFRAASATAPVYSYLFNLDFPIDGGRLAWHCAELPFVFHNAEKIPVCCMPGVSETLQDQMAGAWVSFAQTGCPRLPQGPAWIPYTEENHATMIFDRVCRLGIRFDDELLRLHEKAVPPLQVQS